ncbi:TetR/AcrR family transcriptional regulator [Herbiconiux sp.]|uniref:TetR/AcrR family transcriptional regulator n=1 Tax=Herbiconiux sp. TaxID=1871186 RepID=UPI0025B93526|nr:TetR/AcrR family transcriptional regulator [Herbiconiux sp.]
MPTIESPTATEAPPSGTGLRERKKRETATAIEMAAVDLVARLGLADVTVEAISAQAGVTSRTFFNYYAGKEDAVLGHSRMFPPPSLQRLEFRPGVAILDAVIDALRDEFAAFDFGTKEFQAKRRAILVAHPNLLVSSFQALDGIEVDFALQIERLLGDEGVVPAAERSREAWALVMLVGGVLRLAMHSWSQEEQSGHPLSDHVDIARATILAAARRE